MKTEQRLQDVPWALLYEADCRDIELTDLPGSEPVHTIICDPPYGIEYMLHPWDRNPDSLRSHIWAHLGTLLRPGGYLVVFSGHTTVYQMGEAIRSAGFEMRGFYAWLHPNATLRNPNIGPMIAKERGDMDAAAVFDGFYPAVKGVLEPIIVARKPLSETTQMDNLIKHRTGAVNLKGAQVAGRLPSNLIMTEPVEGTEACAELFIVPKPKTTEREAGLDHLPTRLLHRCNDDGIGRRETKWAPTQRKNSVITVKPVELMAHLVRLHSAPGQVVFDPFMGSGSTGCACAVTGRRFVGSDSDPVAVEIADARVRHWYDTHQPASPPRIQ